jgi:hypothetical protein
MVDYTQILPANTELTFSNDATSVRGVTVMKGSGSSLLTLDYDYNVMNFGRENVTFTMETDNFVTTTPNAYAQNVSTTKNTAVTIDTGLYDRDTNADSKTLTIVSSPYHGKLTAVGGAAQSKVYTPNNDFTGEDKFTFKMNDGTTDSEIKTITIKIT